MNSFLPFLNIVLQATNSQLVSKNVSLIVIILLEFNRFSIFNDFVLNTPTIDDHYIGAFTSMPFTTITCGCYRLVTIYQFPWPSLRTALAMMVLKTCLPSEVK